MVGECIKKYELSAEAEQLMEGELDYEEWEAIVERRCRKGVIKDWKKGVGCKTKLRRY